MKSKITYKILHKKWNKYFDLEMLRINKNGVVLGIKMWEYKGYSPFKFIDFWTEINNKKVCENQEVTFKYDEKLYKGKIIFKNGCFSIIYNDNKIIPINKAEIIY